jgi:hypothetical protein
MSATSSIKSAYRRADAIQRSRILRIAAMILVLIGTGIGWGRIIATTRSLDGHRRAVGAALAGHGAEAPADLARDLVETGRVVVNGETYRNDLLRGRSDLVLGPGDTVADPEVIASALVFERYPPSMPRWLIDQPGTTWMLALVTTGWMLLIVWIGLTLPFLLTLAGTAAAVALAKAAGFDEMAWALGGMGLLTFTFVMLTRLALLVLDPAHHVLAIAHTVVKEASRTRIALVFIVAILILLPLLPLGLDTTTALRYQLQAFIARSMGFTFYLAAVMTLFLSCGTVAFEIRDRQIWQLVTKPVSRLGYLVGKWIGVATVNLIIMSIAGVSIFTYIQYLRDRPVAPGLAGFEDRQQVKDAVLTARVGRKPDYLRLTPEQIRARVDDEIARSDLALLEEVPAAVRAGLRAKIEEAFDVGQRMVPPTRGSQIGAREYVFSGLGPARGLDSMLTLRYRFHIMRDDEHEVFPAIFVINGDPELAFERQYVPTMAHVFTIPPDYIRPDGTLSLTIINPFTPPPALPGAGALNFEAKDFELLYKVGSFEGNFLRAVMLDWVKLSFLAVLGIACATFLSFPVACMTSFTVFIAGSLGPFLAESLRQYYPPSLGAVDWGDAGHVIQWMFMSSIKAVAQGLVYLLQAFGSYRPTQSLVEGRLISWIAVGAGAVRIGVLWSVLALGLGFAVLRKRQLAIYSGHG